MHNNSWDALKEKAASKSISTEERFDIWCERKELVEKHKEIARGILDGGKFHEVFSRLKR